MADRQSRVWRPNLSTLLLVVVVSEIPVFVYLRERLNWSAIHAAYISVGCLLFLAYSLAYILGMLRFSMKAMAVAMTLLGIYLGAVGMEIVNARREREAIASLREFGGSVFVRYDYQLEDVPRSGSGFAFAVGDGRTTAPPPGPEWLRRSFGDELLGDVEYVCFMRGELGDRDLERLDMLFESLPRLAHVTLSRTRVTEKGLAWLKESRPDLFFDYEARSKLAATVDEHGVPRR